MEIYNIDETCEILKLKPPVLRKYSALLEDAGYGNIGRNSNNSRYYTKENIDIFRELMDYKRSGYMTLNDATKSIVERVKGIDVEVEERMPINIVDLAKIEDIKNLQNAVFQLVEHMERTEKNNEKNMAVLTNEIKELRNDLKQAEERKLLEKPEEKPRGIFSMLFKKSPQ